MTSVPILSNKPKKLSISVCIFLICFFVSCAPQLVSHGNEVDMADLAKILEGKTTKREVRGFLGLPSTYSDFGADTWFYMSNRMKTIAFFEKELIKRTIIYIKFSPDDIVETIGKLSEHDQMEISFIDKETPTAGHRVTVLQQLFGNIGRFNTQSQTD